MNKNLITMVMVVSAVVMLLGCATSEERALQKAARIKNVTVALSQRHYKVSVDRMYPMRGLSKNVSYGYSVEVRNDSLISYLPYFGRAYNVPYGGGKGLNFSAPIDSYRTYERKTGLQHIEIGLHNEEDTYLYILEIFDNGNSSIEVNSRQRERIRYSGEIDTER